MADIDYTARDFATIKESLSRYVIASEPSLWSDFFESNLGVILIDFVSYVGDITSFVTDRISEEVFPATANRRQSLLKFSEAVGYSPRGSSPASVRMKTLGTALGTRFTTQGISFNKGVSFTSGGVTFEVAQDYHFNAGTYLLEIDCTAGESGQEVFSASGRQFQEYIIQVPDIINDSWQVFVNGSEWEEVDSVLLREAERIYEVVYTENGYIKVRFGDGYNGKSPMSGAVITIDYRSGGGISGNVGAKTISEGVYGIYDDSTSALVTMTNDSRASGGLDAETTEHMRKWIPGWIKTNSRAVSVQDYLSILNTFTDPVYGSPFRANARLRISGFGNIIEGVYAESRDMPYVIPVDHEFFGIGKGVIAIWGYNVYSYTTDNAPIVPNSVAVSGTVSFGTPAIVDNFWLRDDGKGNMFGDYISGGTVDYDNGVISVIFRGDAVPPVYSPMYVHYEYSPNVITGENRVDKGHLLGYGFPGAVPPYAYSDTLPTTLLVPNEEAYINLGLAQFGVRLRTVLNDGVGGPDIPIELYDSIDATLGDEVGVFMDATLPHGTPSPRVVSSNINYATGLVEVTFDTPVKIYEGVYVYYTDFAYDWSIGDGAAVTFTGYIGERVVPGTLRLHTLVGAQHIFLRDFIGGGGAWELEVIDTGAVVTVVSSTIDYVAGELTFELDNAPDLAAPIKIAYRAYAAATEMPYAALTFVRAIEDITMGGLVNPGMYQWLDDRWYFLMSDDEHEYALPANVVDVWLWSLDSNGYLSLVSDALITAVRDSLYENSIATTQLNVVSGALQPFNVDLRTVYYDRKYDVNTLRSNIREAIIALTTSDDNYPGETLTMSEIYNAIYAVPGVLGFRMYKPISNIIVNKSEMVTFGKVEQASTGAIGLPNTFVLGYGTGVLPAVFAGTLDNVGAANNILNLDNSVKVETFAITATGVEKSVAHSRVGAAPNRLDFVNTEGTSVDELIANTYVDYTTGAIQITYLNPPESLTLVVVSYWTEHAVLSGKLLYTPVIGGTVQFEIGDYVINDDGSGNLSAVNVTGTINYETGDFSIDIENTVDVPAPYDGVTLYVTYEYTFSATFTQLTKGAVTDNIGYCPDWTSP